MIYEFTEDQIAQINGMGLFSRYGAMQGLVIPSADLPVTLESLVEQYGDQARYASKVFGLDETQWRSLAEMWAVTDIEIFRDIELSGVDLKEFLRAEIPLGVEPYDGKQRVI
jgi:hypothetical protein